MYAESCCWNALILGFSEPECERRVFNGDFFFVALDYNTYFSSSSSLKSEIANNSSSS